MLRPSNEQREWETEVFAMSRILHHHPIGWRSRGGRFGFRFYIKYVASCRGAQNVWRPASESTGEEQSEGRKKRDENVQKTAGGRDQHGPSSLPSTHVASNGPHYWVGTCPASPPHVVPSRQRVSQHAAPPRDTLTHSPVLSVGLGTTYCTSRKYGSCDFRKTG